MIYYLSQHVNIIIILKKHECASNEERETVTVSQSQQDQCYLMLLITESSVSRHDMGIKCSRIRES